MFDAKFDRLILHLGAKLKSLLAQYLELERHCAKLKQENEQLLRERNQLMDKQQHAIHEVEGLIHQLKQLEKPI